MFILLLLLVTLLAVPLPGDGRHWLRTLSVADFEGANLSSPLIEHAELERIRQRGGVELNHTLMTSAKAWTVWIIDNVLYVEPGNPNTSKNYAWLGRQMRIEEVLRVLYEALRELSRDAIRLPDVQFGLSLHDVGNVHVWRREHPSVAFVVSRPKREFLALGHLTAPHSQLLVPGPEFNRPRVRADTFASAEWLEASRREWMDDDAPDLPARYRWHAKRPAAIWRGSLHGAGIRRVILRELLRDDIVGFTHALRVLDLESVFPNMTGVNGAACQEAVDNGTRRVHELDGACRALLDRHWVPPAFETHRMRLVRLAREHPDVLDARIVENAADAASLFVDFADFNQWKALLDIDGFGWSERLLHLLRSTSVVVKIESEFEDLVTQVLAPDTHFVQVRRDMRGLLDAVQRVVAWPRARYVGMVRAAHARIAERFSWDRLKAYWIELLVRYAALQRFTPLLAAGVDRFVPFTPCVAINNAAECAARTSFQTRSCTWREATHICTPVFRPIYMRYLAKNDATSAPNTGAPARPLLAASAWQLNAARARFPQLPIFFMWLEPQEPPRRYVPPLLACAMESAARHNPRAPIVLLTPHWHAHPPLDAYDNVLYSSFSLRDLFDDTPFLDMLRWTGEWTAAYMSHPAVFSDFARIALLYKFGGVFFDAHMISVRALDDYALRAPMLSSWSFKYPKAMSNEAMIFPAPRHALLGAMLRRARPFIEKVLRVHGAGSRTWAPVAMRWLRETLAAEGPFDDVRQETAALFNSLAPKEVEWRAVQPGYEWQPSASAYAFHILAEYTEKPLHVGIAPSSSVARHMQRNCPRAYAFGELLPRAYGDVDAPPHESVAGLEEQLLEASP